MRIRPARQTGAVDRVPGQNPPIPKRRRGAKPTIMAGHLGVVPVPFLVGVKTVLERGRNRFGPPLEPFWNRFGTVLEPSVVPDQVLHGSSTTPKRL